MKPREPGRSATEDMFRERLENLLDLRHPLVRLSNEIEWSVFSESFGALYDAELGRPGLPVRLLVGLHYLKHAFDMSDEEVVLRWVENPYWQYFCGEEYFQHRLPLDGSQMSRFRGRIGECVIRRKSVRDSGGCRYVIPELSGTRICWMSVRDSGISRYGMNG